jgi:hypothetical protein
MAVLKTRVGPYSFRHQIRKLPEYKSRHHRDLIQPRGCSIALLWGLNLLNLIDVFPVVHLNFLPKDVKPL